MARTLFDQFSKQYLKTFLSQWGNVTPNQEVPGEAKFIDILFVPSSPPSANPESLGLLGCFAKTPCLLEPFRNPPSLEQVCSCLHKLFHVRAEFQRQANRKKCTLADADLPRLWILAPSASQRLLSGFRLQENPQQWGPGIYFWGDFERAAIVALNQLPSTPETLWLRLLGRGATQEQAIEEVLSLPQISLLRANALELLTIWKINIELSAAVDEEDRKLAMTLSKAYLEWKETTLQQGVQQGIQQGIQQGVQQGIQQERRNTIENFLKARFGLLDEALVAIVQPFSELSFQEYTALLMRLTNLSREELLAKFNDASDCSSSKKIEDGDTDKDEKGEEG